MSDADGPRGGGGGTDADACADVAAAAEAQLLAAVAALDELRDVDPAAFDAWLLALVAAHYADPYVRAAIGYPGPEAIPLPPLPDARDAVLAPLLGRVRERGPTYRDIPPS